MTPRWNLVVFGLAAAGALSALGPASRARAAATGDTLASPLLQEALAAAVTIPGARVDVVAIDRAASDCVTTGADARAEIPRPLEGSGRVAVKLHGSRSGGAACETWAWARVKIFAKVPVAERPVRAGDTLATATRIEEREIKPGHVPAVLTDRSVSDRAFGVGQMIEAAAVRVPGPRPGEAVKVLLVSGSLVIEQTGRAVPCSGGHSCAVLPSGKHVEGTLVDGRLMVQLP